MRLIDIMEQRLIPYPQSRLSNFPGVVTFAGEYDPHSKTARPNMIDIHPQAERRGVGRALIADFEQWAKEQGAVVVQSGYGAWKNSRGFWKSLGYKVGGRKNHNGAYDFHKKLMDALDATDYFSSPQMR